MVEAATTGFVAECFWPDVVEADLEALDRRVRAVTTQLPAEQRVRYLGSMLLREDEVVLCHFEGRAEQVREVAERAAVPFERILEIVSRSPLVGPGSVAGLPLGESGGM